MKGYREPSYQDRMGRAAAAKQEALDKLQARPAPDEAELERRREAALAREAAQAEKREARKAAASQRAADKAQAAESARVPTEEERKAARDARYAARKSRK